MAYEACQKVGVVGVLLENVGAPEMRWGPYLKVPFRETREVCADGSTQEAARQKLAELVAGVCGSYVKRISCSSEPIGESTVREFAPWYHSLLRFVSTERRYDLGKI